MISSKTLYEFIIKATSTLFIVLFVYAANSKFLDFEEFRIQLGQSPIITAYADWVAWGIPLLEYIIAILFFVPRLLVLAFYASYVLMIMFTTYIYLILNFSDFIPCSCGGVLEELTWTEHMIFNLAFVAFAVIGVLFSAKQECLKHTTL
ncbi:methylamine utilization protein MauE [Winogradskyella pacifica]|uniref:Methylamine utilization protein MauE n=1 Tax=Winogradskyella pacifica TaxID=664642 RepID=A0A3D9LMM4_9FLAO|nr:MauE/DoxX family redox-associated membrane protein [Winogradskyella pacifica]REE07794.1 methylamine utilization protein MauE [Winogradskyella pacifica]